MRPSCVAGASVWACARMSLITDEPTVRSQPSSRSRPAPPARGNAQTWIFRADDPIATSVP